MAFASKVQRGWWHASYELCWIKFPCLVSEITQWEVDSWPGHNSYRAFSWAKPAAAGSEHVKCLAWRRFAWAYMCYSWVADKQLSADSQAMSSLTVWRLTMFPSSSNAYFSYAFYLRVIMHSILLATQWITQCITSGGNLITRIIRAIIAKLVNAQCQHHAHFTIINCSRLIAAQDRMTPTSVQQAHTPCSHYLSGRVFDSNKGKHVNIEYAYSIDICSALQWSDGMRESCSCGSCSMTAPLALLRCAKKGDAFSSVATLQPLQTHGQCWPEQLVLHVALHHTNDARYTEQT